MVKAKLFEEVFSNPFMAVVLAEIFSKGASDVKLTTDPLLSYIACPNAMEELLNAIIDSKQNESNFILSKIQDFRIARVFLYLDKFKPFSCADMILLI